jgi:hypothetical protein
MTTATLNEMLSNLQDVTGIERPLNYSVFRRTYSVNVVMESKIPSYKVSQSLVHFSMNKDLQRKVYRHTNKPIDYLHRWHGEKSSSETIKSAVQSIGFLTLRPHSNLYDEETKHQLSNLISKYLSKEAKDDEIISAYADANSGSRPSAKASLFGLLRFVEGTTGQSTTTLLICMLLYARTTCPQSFPTCQLGKAMVLDNQKS